MCLLHELTIWAIGHRDNRRLGERDYCVDRGRRSLCLRSLVPSFRALLLPGYRGSVRLFHR